MKIKMRVFAILVAAMAFSSGNVSANGDELTEEDKAFVDAVDSSIEGLENQINQDIGPHGSQLILPDQLNIGIDSTGEKRKIIMDYSHSGGGGKVDERLHKTPYKNELDN